MAAGAVIGAAAADVTKRDTRYRATTGAGASDGTLGAKLTAGLTGTVDVDGRAQMLPAFSFG